MHGNILKSVQDNLDKIIHLYNSNTGSTLTSQSAKISQLGTGENNLNLLISTGTEKFVLRIVLNENYKHRVEREFKVLQLLPNKIAPTPIALDLSRSILPHSFLIVSFVEGEHVQDWTINHLKLLAKTMAKYHSIKSQNFGDIGSDQQNLNMEKFFFSINDEYFDSFPTLWEDPDIGFVLPKLINLLRESQDLFDKLYEFSLIHGDLTKENILFEGDEIHILDWEVCSFGDSANDFATFFYEDFAYYKQSLKFKNYKWRIKLSPQESKSFIDEYLNHIDDPTFRDRLKVWMAFDKMCSLIYCKQRLEGYKREGSRISLPKETFESEIEKLNKSLRVFFN
jgi:aminoglycoside phosphotransferase (APT) family kinase protein